MNKLIENFLEENDNKRLFLEYLKYPSDVSKRKIQNEFNEFYLRIKLLSYFSKSLHYVAQNFDKKIRDKNKKMIWLSDNYEENTNILENIPDEDTLENEIPYLVENVENYFEHELLYEMVSTLTLRQKKIIYLFYVKNLSDKQISKTLSISVQAVNKQRNSVLNNLKRRVGNGNRNNG